MDKLSETSAVHVARHVLAELRAAGPGAYSKENSAEWLGRVLEALLLVLAAIGDAEGGTP